MSTGNNKAVALFVEYKLNWFRCYFRNDCLLVIKGRVPKGPKMVGCRRHLDFGVYTILEYLCDVPELIGFILKSRR